MKRHFLFFLLLIIMVGLRPFPATAAPQATIVVNSLADDQTVNGNCTLREALLAAEINFAWDGCAAGSANEPDLIVFAVSGVIHMTLGQFVITSPVIIRGNGRGETIIDANDKSRIFRAEAPLKLESLTLQNGHAISGGAAIQGYFSSSPPHLLELDNVVIQDSNSTGGNGGAIEVAFWDLTIKNSLLQRNSAALRGGAIFMLNTNAIIEDSIVRENNTADIGGGIRGNRGALTITRTLIEGNNSSNHAGGLYYGLGYFSLTDSAIRNNVAETGNGGGISFLDVYTLIEGSTISGNSARQGNGGGIRFRGSFDDVPQFLMTNSTVSGNTAFWGGGLYLDPTGDTAPTIYHTTIADNTALSGLGAGGAIFLDPDSNPVSLTRSIISGNSGFPTCYPIGALNSAGFSLLQDNACGSHTTDLVGVDPLLAPLAANGGPTETHALQPDSPAIDVADCVTGIVVDQRGVMRPQGERCDSGAFEFEDLAVYLPLIVRSQ